jgi:spermidine synthase
MVRLLNLDSEVILALTLGLVALVSALAYRERARLKSGADRLASFFAPKEVPAKNIYWPLLLVSFATLYIEVMMIRWIGTEVRVFAYFQNLALITCFLGFGLGCYWANRRKSVIFGLLAMTTLIGLVQAPIGVWQRFLTNLSTILTLSPDANLWGVIWTSPGNTGPLLSLAAVVVVATFLLLLVVMMIPLGQWVGSYLDSAPKLITAYSLNLLGSVVGIWAVAGVAFLWLPPTYWFGLAFVLYLFIRPPSARLAGASAVLLIISLLFLRSPDTATIQTYWSPYQKLQVVSRGDQQYSVQTNNTGYMQIANMTPEFLARNPEIASRRNQSAYDSPFRFAKRCESVLIMGAGGGNDAAAALRAGATRVDAVEIDPVILSLGKRLHPERPYDSPKVRKILQDARAFLRQTHEKYDVVLFGLLDSHTNFSDYSNMRIDNYVFTKEAFQDARALLKPDGILILRFAVWPPWEWMGQRFYGMLSGIFPNPPIVYYASEVGRLSPGTVFITSDDQSLWTRAKQPDLAELVGKNPPIFPLSLVGAPAGITDDWPYVYHRGRSIPTTYLTISAILLAMAFLLVRKVFQPKHVGTWHFFFLGAGFLLLETQLVSRLALYFGTTWLVNCAALTAILIMLVVANIYVARSGPVRLGPYYFLLTASLIANYFFPWHLLPYGTRTVGLLLSGAYACSLFFAGVIFTETFRWSAQKSNAFGANIVGAVAGGLAQNLSFIIGMKALLLLAAVFYASAGVSGLLGERRAKLGAVASAPAASQ